MEHFFEVFDLGFNFTVVLTFNCWLIDDWALLGFLYDCYFLLKIIFNFYGGVAGKWRGSGGEVAGKWGRRGCRNII